MSEVETSGAVPTGNMGLSPIDVVSRMIYAFGEGDGEKAAAYCSEDCVYLNIPFPPATVGRAAIAAAINGLIDLAADVTTDVVASVTDGTTVMNRRYDTWTWKSSGTPITLEVMGHFVVRDGLITEWADFFDDGQAQIVKHLEAAAAASQ
ncbi:nuclear transport factor 2 family protein [Amycolatopsis sp. cg5]|uniref:nuclear transport factor 2 family protein n=1 Tax=Amycolatopsis sp. cg5 TaxID=3238802 RepID=UPI00352425A9